MRETWCDHLFLNKNNFVFFLFIYVTFMHAKMYERQFTREYRLHKIIIFKKVN